LVLDDGTCLSEITAICEYLEDTQALPPLVGTTPEEKAETRMWTRKLDLGIAEPMANGFRFAEGLEIFKDRLHVIPQAADDLKATAQEGLEKLDGWMDGKQYICGDRFTMADVHLFGMLDFFASAGQPIDSAQNNVAAWYERVGARPSAENSLHPAAQAVGMRG
jgi:glutathione S-transferase